MSFQSQPNDSHDKLVVLYLLNKARVELSELQLVRITSELGILDYFSLKKALYFLVQTNHIAQHEGDEHLSYVIAPEGVRTLEALENDIRHSTRKDIDAYLKGKRKALAQESQFRAVLQQDKQGRYQAHLEIFTEGRTIFSLCVEAANRADGQLMVQKWKEAAIPVYQSVLANLC